MRVFKSPVILKHNPYQRPIYMVSNLVTLRKLRLTSDVVNLFIVVLKPMPSKRSLTTLFNGMPWMEDRNVTYFGVEGVPDVLREHGAFTPRAHSARIQFLEGEARQAMRARIIAERKKKARFQRAKDALQKTQAVVRMKF